MHNLCLGAPYVDVRPIRKPIIFPDTSILPMTTQRKRSQIPTHIHDFSAQTHTLAHNTAGPTDISTTTHTHMHERARSRRRRCVVCRRIARRAACCGRSVRVTVRCRSLQLRPVSVALLFSPLPLPSSPLSSSSLFCVREYLHIGRVCARVSREARHCLHIKRHIYI